MRHITLIKIQFEMRPHTKWVIIGHNSDKIALHMSVDFASIIQ